MTEQFYAFLSPDNGGTEGGAKTIEAILNAVKSADKRADGANWFGREKLVFLRTNKIATHKSHRLVTAYFPQNGSKQGFRVFSCFSML